MRPNRATVDLIKVFEGLRLEAYLDAADPPVWTIGYGTTAAAGVGVVPKAGMYITQAEAEMYLRRGVEKFAAQIAPMITRPINENEFGAFVSLAYNIGPGAFRSSSALRRFNEGDRAAAADAILLWNKAGGRVLNGLVRRRAAERDLFLAPVPQKSLSGGKNDMGTPSAPPKSLSGTTNPLNPQSPLAALWRSIVALLGR